MFAALMSQNKDMSSFDVVFNSLNDFQCIIYHLGPKFVTHLHVLGDGIGVGL